MLCLVQNRLLVHLRLNVYEDTTNKINNVLLLFLFLVIYVICLFTKITIKVYGGVQSHTFASSIKLGSYGSSELWFFFLFFGFMLLSIECHNRADF